MKAFVLAAVAAMGTAGAADAAVVTFTLSETLKPKYVHRIIESHDGMKFRDEYIGLPELYAAPYMTVFSFSVDSAVLSPFNLDICFGDNCYPESGETPDGLVNWEFPGHYGHYHLQTDGNGSVIDWSIAYGWEYAVMYTDRDSGFYEAWTYPGDGPCGDDVQDCLWVWNWEYFGPKPSLVEGESVYMAYRVSERLGSASWTVTGLPAPVPLPASALLLLGGAGALGALRIRSRSAS